MTDAGQQIDFLAPGPPVDLSNCEREPIHVPGSIQPDGLLGPLLPDRPEDDVALVAVRLRLQDAPGQAPT